MADEFLTWLGVGLVILIGMLLITNASLYIQPTGTYTTGTYREFIPIDIGEGTRGPIHVGIVSQDAVKTETINFVAGENVIFDSVENTEIYNGLLFGDKQFTYAISEDADYVEMNFRVRRTNTLDRLIFKLNDRVIESKEYPLGVYSVSVEGEIPAGSVLTAQAASSGWKIWAPTLYDLKDIEVKYRPASSRNTITFDLDAELDRFKEARLDLTTRKNVGPVKIRLNDMIIYDGLIASVQSIYLEKSKLRQGSNVISFESEGRIVGTASALVFYQTDKFDEFSTIFTINQTNYNRMRSGFVKFTITNVDKAGGFSFKINNDFQEFHEAERRTYTIYFGKQDVSPGSNIIEIKGLEGASFNLRLDEITVF